MNTDIEVKSVGLYCWQYKPFKAIIVVNKTHNNYLHYYVFLLFVYLICFNNSLPYSPPPKHQTMYNNSNLNLCWKKITFNTPNF